MGAPGPLTNQKLGDRYLLGDLLGQGGFGAVYKARHLLLNRQQAVKILLEQHFTSPKFRERFTREAQTLAALDQPNIVHVDDFGFDGNRAYLVMPYIGGGTLQHILRARGALPPDQVSRYLEQITAALDYAHKRNVAHLDLKPLNLLVHEDGRLLLSDFGLAHLMEQGAIEGSTSLQFGTPTYMAPEHLQGQPEQRSDIYALGVIVYQMLTGRVPFEGSNFAAIMLKHMTEPPPPLRSVRPDLPPALEGVLNRALAKRAADRYQSAGALLSDFQAAVAGRPTRPVQSAPPLNTTVRAANPPVAGSAAPTINPAGVISGPPQYSGPLPTGGFAPPPVYQPVPVAVAAPSRPKKTRIWTQGFTVLFVGAAIAGAIDFLVLGNAYSFASFLTNLKILEILTAVICLVGLRFATSKLMHAGLILQVISLGVEVAFGGFIFYSSYLIRAAVVVAGAASLVCISYALVRRRPSDGGLTALQVIITFGVIGYLTQGFRGFSFDLEDFLALALFICPIFSVALLLFRFQVWKRHPVVLVCLSLPQLVLGLYLLRVVVFSNAIYFIAIGILPALGFLVLVQTERMKRKAGVI